jgi:hypothetical protein
MDWLGSDHVGTPTDTHATVEGLFSVRGPCREDIREYGNGSEFNIRGLNLAVVKPTTVQVTKLPL